MDKRLNFHDPREKCVCVRILFVRMHFVYTCVLARLLAHVGPFVSVCVCISPTNECPFVANGKGGVRCSPNPDCGHSGLNGLSLLTGFWRCREAHGTGVRHRTDHSPHSLPLTRARSLAPPLSRFLLFSPACHLFLFLLLFTRHLCPPPPPLVLLSSL